MPRTNYTDPYRFYISEKEKLKIQWVSKICCATIIGNVFFHKLWVWSKGVPNHFYDAQQLFWFTLPQLLVLYKYGEVLVNFGQIMKSF